MLPKRHPKNHDWYNETRQSQRKDQSTKVDTILTRIDVMKLGSYSNRRNGLVT